MISFMGWYLDEVGVFEKFHLTDLFCGRITTR